MRITVGLSEDREVIVMTSEGFAASRDKYGVWKKGIQFSAYELMDYFTQIKDKKLIDYYYNDAKEYIK